MTSVLEKRECVLSNDELKALLDMFKSARAAPDEFVKNYMCSFAIDDETPMTLEGKETSCELTPEERGNLCLGLPRPGPRRRRPLDDVIKCNMDYVRALDGRDSGGQS